MGQDNMNQNDKMGQKDQGMQKDQGTKQAPGHDQDKNKDGQFGGQRPDDKNQQNRQTQK